MTSAAPEVKTRLDPVTLEILSSRLAAINDEAAATMRQFT